MDKTLILFQLINIFINLVKYKDFYKHLRNKKIFTIKDLKLLGIPHLNIKLHRWEKEGDILRISRGVYVFAEYKNDISGMLIANKLYSPSYVSMEYALNYYGFIPDIPFTVTSISSKTTRTFDTGLGKFSYRHMSSKYFFGYTSKAINKHSVLIADPEKALTDYFYFHPGIKNEDDFAELRLNTDNLRETVNTEKIKTYVETINKKYILNIYNIFINYLNNA